ncbi:2331_t:CDS:1, partial [Racocetra fulgida]
NEGVIESHICDLGLSKITDRSTIHGEIYGVMPYIAPETLSSGQYKKESDIYSFGAIMSEMSTGRPPFDDESHDIELLSKIINGLRPRFAPGTPDCYIQLSNRCMDADPTKRPSVNEIYDKISSWWTNLIKEPRILNKELEIRNEFLAADKIIPTLKFTSRSHPNAVYTSRSINIRNITNTYTSARKF